MSTLFILDVETEADARRATLRLGDDAGRPLESQGLSLDEHPTSR